MVIVCQTFFKLIFLLFFNFFNVFLPVFVTLNQFQIHKRLWLKKAVLLLFWFELSHQCVSSSCYDLLTYRNVKYCFLVLINLKNSQGHLQWYQYVKFRTCFI